MTTIEDVIARIERSSRMNRADGVLAGYVLEIDEWREIRAALRHVETETDASGLSEAERDALEVAVGNHCIHTGKPDYSLPNWCRDCNQAATESVAPAVERIVAERVRVVEGERDAESVRLHVEWHKAETRAESAEAAHEALVAGVEALLARNDGLFVLRGALRALLAGGGE
jgi:hypothetical protein